MKVETISVLVAELTGFNDYTSDIGAGDLNDMLVDLFEIASTATRVHQGKVIRFTGNTFTVAFTPAGTQSHALLSADAAVDFKERIENWIAEQRLKKSLGFKIGLSCGEAVLGEVGEGENRQYTAIGKAVDDASRLCEFAEKHQLLADNNIAQQLSEQFIFQKLEPLPIRGSKETLAVYELKERKRVRIKPEDLLERQIASVMVGRDEELSLVEDGVKKLIDGEGGIISIVGKAGIGKSRLMAEIKAQPMMGEVNLIEGRAQSTGRNLSFHPIIHIIKSMAGIKEEDVPAVSSEKLQAAIEKITAEPTSEIYPFMATLMGIPISGAQKERIKGIEGEALEKLILKNLRDLVSLAAKQKPLVIMIEDLHWADNSSISFLESLYKLTVSNPVMFINIFRPGYEETGDHLARYLAENLKEKHTSVVIHPLIQDESVELIRNLLNKVNLPEAVNQVIIRKTEGNPFFIEEVIRSFIDDGIIEKKAEGFQVSDRINHVNIPETINDVILSRVDKLDEKTRELLRTASVIGRNFYYRVLEEAADTIEELDQRLGYLKEIQLISESGQKKELEFLFKHALAQQATYESIVLNTKKELHHKIARSIEKVFAANIQEFFGTLAYHYEMAEISEKTLEYLTKAGEEALLSGASNEAYSYLKKALSIYREQYPDNPDKEILAKYYYHLSLACHRGGLNLEAIDYITRFQSLYLKQLPASRFRLVTGLSWRLVNFLLALNFPGYYFRKTPAELDDLLIKLIITKGESLVTVSPKSIFLELIYFSNRLVKLDLSRTSLGLGLLMEYSGIFIWTGISFSIGKKVINVAGKFIAKKNQQTWMKFRYDQIMYRLFTGTFTPDEDEDEVFEVGLKSGAFWETTTYHMFSTYIHLERGDWARSCKTRERLLETAEVFENEHSRVQYYRMNGIAYSKFRRINDALRNSEEGMDMIGKTGHVTVLMLVQCSRVLALALQEEFEDADKLIAEAWNIIEKRKRGVIFYSTYLITKVHLELAKARKRQKTGDGTTNWKSLLNLTKEAVKISKRFTGNLTEAYRLRGEALYMAGQHKKALKYFERSIDFGTSSGSHIELARAYFELGKFLADPQTRHNSLKRLDANDYLEKANHMFDEMGLEWDAEQLLEYRS